MAFFSKVRGMLQHKMASHLGRETSAPAPFLFQAIRCMSTKLFVGGLSYQMDEEALRKSFENYGQVYEARIILDRETGNSRGFGFITFESEESANAAIMALDGQDLQGRKIKVNHAHDREQGFGGGRGYQGGGGYGGNYQGSGGYGGNYQGSGGYGGNYQGGAGYNNSGSTYQCGGDNYSNNPGGVGGYNTTGGGSYDSNFASSGGNHSIASGNYPSSGGNHSIASGNYPSSGGNIDSVGDFSTTGDASYDQAPGVIFDGTGSNNFNADGSNVASNFTSGYENAPGTM